MRAEPPAVSRKETSKGLAVGVLPFPGTGERFELGEGFLGVGLGEGGGCGQGDDENGGDASGFGHNVFLSSVLHLVEDGFMVLVCGRLRFPRILGFDE